MYETLFILLIFISLIYFGGQLNLTFMEVECMQEIKTNKIKESLNAGMFLDKENIY